MADQKTLAILYLEVEVWNEWRRENREKKIDLSGVDLSGANLCKADLNRANLNGAELFQTDFREANLFKSELHGADLFKADLFKADLFKADLRGADLYGAFLYGSSFIEASLVGASLIKSNAIETNFSKADLSKANFNRANLTQAKALGTNFTSTNLTGACIQDWHINSETNFTDVICDYIYLKEGQKERRPSDPTVIFTPGDFAKLVQKSLETVDLIFADGIDWKAFLSSLNELKTQYGEDNLTVQGIERKSGRSFVIRLEVPPKANKAEIERQSKEYYENNLKLLETRYDRELQAKDEQIILYRQHNTSLEKIIDMLGNKPMQNIINVTAQATQGDIMAGDRNIKMGDGNYIERNEGDYVQGNKYIGQHQTLAEAASEIQSLLKQLEQTYPTNTTSQKMKVAAEAVDKIESTPSLKNKVINAIKEGGLKALEKAIDNPAGAFIIGAIESWQEVKKE